MEKRTVLTKYIPAKHPAWLLLGKNDIKHAPSSVGMRRTLIASHREYPLEIAHVDSIVEIILTAPEGIFRRALCLLVYPKSLIKIDEKVVITPLGIVMRIVNCTSNQVCMSPSDSSNEPHLKTLWPTPAVSSCSC